MSCTKKPLQLMIIAAIGLAMLPATALAQRGRGGHGGSRGGSTVVVAPYYAPFYGAYYNPFFWDFYGWGYPGPYPPAFYGPGLPGGSAARIQVTPRQTEVYVDGYLAGIVDDFDGFSQRLHLPPGEHVIELYLDGYKPVTQNILFQPGDTYRLRLAMEPLAPGDMTPPRPMPRAVSPSQPAQPAPPPIMYDAFGRPSPTAPPAPPALPAPPAQGSGVLAIRVQPGDAAVLVDGEPWQGSGNDRLEVRVTAGTHRIEIRKDGYLPFSTTVQVGAGQTTPINVSLTKGEQ